jgi:hypothetical protein
VVSETYVQKIVAIVRHARSDSVELLDVELGTDVRACGTTRRF